MTAKYEWIFPKASTADNGEYPQFFLSILASRNLSDPDEVEKFLNPDYERDLHDPRLLKDAERAAVRIWQAIEKKERVLIYADYDADGISAAVLMAEFFKECGLIPHLYMPDRRIEGHGLHQNAVKEFTEKKLDLLVVLDCGVTNHDAIAEAQAKGMEVVMIEHHQVVEKIPKPYALVNPHQPGDEYPFKNLCATGVTFKVLQLLAKKAREKGVWEEGREKWLLDLVALATVADMMPLQGENRALVKYGLFVLAQTRRVGLQELFKVARVSPFFDRETLQTNIDSVTVGFSLSPRINAASRMSHAALAYNLLTSDNIEDARLLALELEEHNQKRRREIDYLMKELLKRLSGKEIPSFIMEGGETFPIPLLGLVANRLKERFSRPVMLIDESSHVHKASLRAPDGFDLMAALSHVSDILIQYGGHKGAAGCSFEPTSRKKIQERLEQYSKEHLETLPMYPQLPIDSEIALSDITYDNAVLLQRMGPFGVGNELPRLLIQGAEFVRSRTLGTVGKHAKLFFKDNEGEEYPILFFFHNGELAKLISGERYDIVGELSLNEWRGKKEAQFKLVDIRDHSVKHGK